MLHQLITTALLLYACTHIHGDEYPLRYEGVPYLQGLGHVDVNVLQGFLPFNPVIIEAGAYTGDGTARLSQLWPQSSIYAFEPNPRAFRLLQNKVKEKHLPGVLPYNFALADYNGTATLYLCHGTYGKDPSFEYSSALLPPTPAMEIHYQGPTLEVPCVTLDYWCAQNRIDHIDLLMLELQGNELQVLMASPEILTTVKAICTQTHFFPFREEITHYSQLKSFLESHGFVLMQHWYQANLGGNAIFLSEELFDAYFKYCLGLNLRN